MQSQGEALIMVEFMVRAMTMESEDLHIAEQLFMDILILEPGFMVILNMEHGQGHLQAM